MLTAIIFLNKLKLMNRKQCKQLYNKQAWYQTSLTCEVAFNITTKQLLQVSLLPAPSSTIWYIPMQTISHFYLLCLTSNLQFLKYMLHEEVIIRQCMMRCLSMDQIISSLYSRELSVLFDGKNMQEISYGRVYRYSSCHGKCH